ncbi:MAG TPA: DNA repair protein RecN [bacterium]|nr:DNA repair protein RecN [bacterium]
MLKQLYIEDFVLIDRVALEFGPGFTVLTGETGAGKSIIVSALELLLGGRGDSLLVRRGADRARLEAVFEGNPRAAALLDEEGIEADGGELILRREIGADGRSRCYANNRPVTVASLAALAGSLVELHGQFSELPALKGRGQTELLDDYAGLAEQRLRYEEAFARWRDLGAECKQLEDSRAERGVLLDGLAYMIQELESAELREGEEEELREKRGRVRHAVRIKEDVEAALALIAEGDGAISSQLTELEKVLADLAEVVPSAAGAAGRLADVNAVLDEINRELAGLRAAEEGEAVDLEAIESRLALLERLKRKYGKDVAGVIAHLDELRAKKRDLEQADDRLADAEEERAAAAQEALTQAGELSERRRDAAEKLTAQVKADLPALGMEGAAFRVGFVEPSRAALPREGAPPLGPSGAEEVVFELAANPGEEMKPLARVASGGELSRVMLAVRSASAGRAGMETIVFDEVDTGIGGRVGHAVGNRLHEVAAARQVVCVTHLAQIAARADTQFYVDKVVEGGRATIRVTGVDGRLRLEELARMLGGGKPPTPTTLKYARELLDTVRREAGAGAEKGV